MSGRDVVRGLRESGALAKPAGHRVDMVLGLVALVAIAACAYVGLGLLNKAQPPVAPMAAVQLAQAGDDDRTWTEADTARCRAEARARAASNEGVPGELAMANQAITDGGFSAMATMVACRATTKIARLCDPTEKAAFVATVNDYVTRLDLVVAGLNVQGGSIALVGGMLGVEDPASAYDLSKDDTIAYLKIYHDRVVAGMQALAKGGLIAQSDFGVFLGMGVSSTVSHMFEGITADHSVCA